MKDTHTLKHTPNRSTLSRRRFTQASALAAAHYVALAHTQAWALQLSDLSNAEASAGLKQALEQGALSAVGLLGKKDGFLGNPKVRIPLPGHLEDVGKLLKQFGQGKRVDELVTGMNRAAEKAVPYSRDLLRNAVREMDVMDAKNIITGGDRSITDFFADKTRLPLTTQFLPIVSNVTDEIKLAQKFNKFAKKASRFGLVSQNDSSIEQYVTSRTLDGLYTIIGEQEVALRHDPLGASSDLLRKVFGSL